MNFRPEQYYDWLLIELEDIASEVPDLSLKKHDALRFVELSFTTVIDPIAVAAYIQGAKLTIH